MSKLIFVALLAAATPALVQAETVSRTVRVADLDLRSPAGVAELDRRLSRAARQACETGGIKTMWENRQAIACRNEALARAGGDREARVAAAQTTRLAVR